MEFNRVFLFPQFMTFMKQETNKEVIEKVLECIRDIADEMGPAGVMGHIEMIITSLEALLDKNAPCQTRGKEAMSDGVGGEEDDVEEEHESEEDEDDLDHDEIILGNTTDVMISLARCMTDGFTTYLVRLGPKLVPYLSDEHPKSDKVMAIGCLGEVLKACPSAINVYFNDFLSVLLKHSQNPDGQLTRNVSYSFGILAEKAPEALFAPHLLTILQTVKNMHTACEEDAAKENCVATIIRIIDLYKKHFSEADYNVLFD